MPAWFSLLPLGFMWPCGLGWDGCVGLVAVLALFCSPCCWFCWGAFLVLWEWDGGADLDAVPFLFCPVVFVVGAVRGALLLRPGTSVHAERRGEPSRGGRSCLTLAVLPDTAPLSGFGLPDCLPHAKCGRPREGTYSRWSLDVEEGLVWLLRCVERALPRSWGADSPDTLGL